MDFISLSRVIHYMSVKTKQCIRRRIDAKLNEVVRFESRFEGDSKEAQMLKAPLHLLRHCFTSKSETSPFERRRDCIDRSNLKRASWIGTEIAVKVRNI